MKNTSLTSLVLAFILMFSYKGFSQDFPGLDKSPMDVSAFPSSYRDADKIVKLVYSRPQLKGRPVTKLAPNNKIWRTGANEAPEITFYKDVTFGGKSIKAGSYSLFTIPGETQWTIIINTQVNVWGSFFYNESDDVIRVAAKTTKSTKKIEAFSILFEGEEEEFTMYLGWGNTVISIPIKA